MAEQEGEWVEQEQYDGFEVNREGDYVYFALSSIDGAVQRFDFTPEDAETIGMALIQAAQEPEESP